ncbi:hypothetical protein [Alloyangia pacifica]|nr:hypothetical protein [Alloyangia pacifica]
MSSQTPESPTPAESVPSGRRIFRRGPWEMAASILIGIGVVMLMQPFVLWAYSWSFPVTLIGTVMFIVVSHFPD